MTLLKTRSRTYLRNFHKWKTGYRHLSQKMHQSDRKFIDIQASRHYDSQTCDEIKAKQLDLDMQLKTEKLHNTRLSTRHDHMNREKNDLDESLLDIQSRTMRDNLLFFNIEESVNETDRKEEVCTEKILIFCEETLQMQDVRSKVKIDRAHRIGRNDPKKKRPIVTKFN